MTRAVGNLKAQAEYAQSRDWEKSRAPQKPTVDISTFAGTDCKLTAPRPAVGVSGVTALRRWASMSDTKMMDAIQRPAELQREETSRVRQCVLLPRMSAIYKGGFYPPTLKGGGGPPSPFRGGCINPYRENTTVVRGCSR